MADKTNKSGAKWRLNVLDIVIIAVALAAAVFILNAARSDDGGIISSAPKETVLYTVELTNIQGNVAELIKPGDQLVDKVEKRAIGTVVSVTIGPYIASQKNSETGDYNLQEVPNRQTAVIIVRAEAVVSDSAIRVDGFAIRAGAQISLNGPLYHGSGYILSIDRDGDYNA